MTADNRSAAAAAAGGLTAVAAAAAAGCWCCCVVSLQERLQGQQRTAARAQQHQPQSHPYVMHDDMVSCHRTQCNTWHVTTQHNQHHESAHCLQAQGVQ
jgi:hypothetical protein